ncbi:oxygenase MpaB family protein [Sciscionella sediminilitoris]|uniref:oxygenase MpaB family protein n=1 Tax=Sciscionella sediminilitoris TaxID=1445613 RepID=UPI0004DEE5D3|nr:oxygenase MpaB family protein [Sciscionella sp. SE31]
MREPKRLLDTVHGAALLGATANVIMQLAMLPVGHGVAESRVESGQLFRHPIKRLRTTLTYLAVAISGTEKERQLYREATNASHRDVHSRPGDPVRYNAFDRELQLWVAACLYKGVEDTFRFLNKGAQVPEHIYQEAATLGTTLQVPAEMWPADREEFEKYWQDGMSRIEIDELVQEYLYKLIMFEFMPKPFGKMLGNFNRFVTTGFLPEPFREQLGLPWNARKQQQFERLIGLIGTLTRPLPPILRRFPFNGYLWDMRVRILLRRKLV